MSSSTTYDAMPADIANELVGKVVTAIDTNAQTMTLADGTVLTFQDTQGCCAWFAAELTAGNLTDNAVTNVNLVSEGEDAYTVHIMAADNKIAALDVYGDSTSGYYCHSINLIITKES